MSTKLPYVVQPGTISKILLKIKEAKTPDRFTQDFLQTKLGFKGGNYRQFIPLAKKLGLLNSDGTPTELYKKFRNTATSKAAVAQAMRLGYKELFERNEYAQNMKKEELKGLVVEITGLEEKDDVVQLVCRTFENLKTLSDFEASLDGSASEEPVTKQEKENLEQPGDHAIDRQREEHRSDRVKLGLSYTINLVLPKTDDPAVFNAIFRSLRENLLRE